jgi:hypothetical protein
LPRAAISKIIAIYSEVGFKKTCKLIKNADGDPVIEIDDGETFYKENFETKFAEEVNYFAK